MLTYIQNIHTVQHQVHIGTSLYYMHKMCVHNVHRIHSMHNIDFHTCNTRGVYWHSSLSLSWQRRVHHQPGTTHVHGHTLDDRQIQCTQMLSVHSFACQAVKDALCKKFLSVHRSCSSAGPQRYENFISGICLDIYS